MSSFFFLVYTFRYQNEVSCDEGVKLHFTKRGLYETLFPSAKAIPNCFYVCSSGPVLVGEGKGGISDLKNHKRILI